MCNSGVQSHLSHADPHSGAQDRNIGRSAGTAAALPSSTLWACERPMFVRRWSHG